MATRRRTKTGTAADVGAASGGSEEPGPASAGSTAPAGGLEPWLARKRGDLGVLALAIAAASALSEWRVFRAYEATLWKPALQLSANFGLALALALALALSPTGRTLKPGADPATKGTKPKMSFIGLALILLGVWMGFGFFGPCGVVTAAGATTAAIFLLP